MEDDLRTKFPKVIVLDLDGTIWTPEMYELWGGGGAPFRAIGADILKDRAGTRVTLFDGVETAILAARQFGANLGVASTTDEPRWARECLAKFHIVVGETRLTLEEVFRGNDEIYKGNKRMHLLKIKENTGVEFNEILFIDNEYGNIRNVQTLGVNCFYAPNGLTKEAWEKAIDSFLSRSIS